MSEIGKSGGHDRDPGLSMRQGDRDAVPRGQGRRPDTGDARGRPPGTAALQAERAHFEARLERARAGTESRTGERDGDRDRDPGRDARLLAEAGAGGLLLPLAPGMSPLAPPAGDGPGAGAAPSGGEPARAAMAIAERVAVLAEAPPVGGTAGRASVVRLELAADTGLASVTVDLAAGRIDVMLSHAGGLGAETLSALASDLALRLRARFPDRTVRILDRIEAEAAPETADGGFGLMAAVFRAAGGGSP
ncbi:hypothetical protein [Prosthecomicrobium sp. N25]|uniref:hypothetical protein n=1 Tax=Prosthecomicrobium sp. N25 TaxID=3129254 RepID=UPI003076DE24